MVKIPQFHLAEGIVDQFNSKSVNSDSNQDESSSKFTKEERTIF